MKRILGVVLGLVLFAPSPASAAEVVLTLDEALEHANRHAPRLRRDRANVRRAKARVAEAAQLQNPELRVGVDTADGFDELPRTQSSLRFKLDHPAERARRKSRRREDYLHAAMVEESDQRETERAVRTLYVDHAHLRGELEISTREVELQRERVVLTREAVPYGQRTPVDVRTAERALLQASLDVRAHRRALAELESELAGVVGIPLEDVRGHVRHVLPVPAPLPDTETLRSASVEASPELELGSRIVAERVKQVRAARWSAVPWTDFLQVGRSFPTPDRQGGVEVVVGVTVPLMSLGLRSRRAAEATRDAAVLARTTYASELERTVLRWSESARLAAFEYAELGDAAETLGEIPKGATALQRNDDRLGGLEFERARLDARRDYARAIAELQVLGALDGGGSRG